MSTPINSTLTPKVRYSQKSILVIEDFAEFARSLRGMLTAMGCKKITLVYNGDDAVQACKEHKYDVILSDYNLGNSKDGQQVLEELHHFKLLKSNSVFMMITAENTSAMVMGALEFQPDNYLTKPFSTNILKARLDKAIIKKDLLAPIVRLKQKKQWDAALALCEQVSNDNSKVRMACLRQKFYCLRALKRFDQALELVTDLVNDRPLPWAMLGIGEIFYAKGELNRSAEQFKDMITEFPMALEAYDWLAKVQYQLGQSSEAQSTLVKAVERSPKALQRQKLLGKVAEENNDIETMTSAFRQAVKYGNKSAFASADEFVKLTKSLGSQLKSCSDSDRKKLLNEAASVFEKLERRFKENPKAQFRKAVSLADFSAITDDKLQVEKSLNKAERLYEKIEEHMTAAESIETCESLKHLGQSELAESILEDAVEQYFDDPSFIKKAAKLTTNKNLIANSQKANKLNNQAISFFKKQDYAKAIECFSQAALITPNNVNINLNHVQALLKQAKISGQEKTNLQSAETTLTNITRLSPEDPRFSRYSELSRLTQLMLQKI